MNWMQWIILILLLGSVGVGVYYYNDVPEYMVTHWNATGEADGFMEKDVGLFLMPAAMIVLLIFFYLIPHIDPKKENIKKFDKYYEGFIFIFMFFLAYIHFLSVAWNLGYVFEINRLTAPAVGVLFIYLGMLCGKSKQNWFIGIRTPWTLSSERVWARTHNIAKDIFMGIGALWIIVGILAPAYILYLVGLLIVAALILFVDSYFEYKKELAGVAAAPKVDVAAPLKTKAGKAAVAKKASKPQKKTVATAPEKKAPPKAKPAEKKAAVKPVEKKAEKPKKASKKKK